MGLLSVSAGTFKITSVTNGDAKVGDVVEYLNAAFKVEMPVSAQSLSNAVTLVNKTTGTSYNAMSVYPNSYYFAKEGSITMNIMGGSTGISGEYELTIPEGTYVAENGDKNETFVGTWTIQAPETFDITCITNRDYVSGMTVKKLDMYFKAEAESPIVYCDGSKIEIKKGSTPLTRLISDKAYADGSYRFYVPIWYEKVEEGENVGECTSAGTYTLTFEKGAFRDDNNRVSNAFSCTWTIKSSAVDQDVVIMRVDADSKFATFYAPFEVELPAGVTASTVEVADDKTTLQLTAVAGNIPAMTPVVLYAEEGLSKTRVYGKAETSSATTFGALTGVCTDTKVNDGYVLQNQGGVVGFYKVEDAKTVTSNHAYLTVDSDVKAFMLDDAETAITAISRTIAKPSIYDLSGRRISKAQKGLYIVDGKKIFIQK